MPAQDRELRITVRVRPGASRTRVGGRYGDALVVAVTARAVDGAATKAVLRAVADAFGLRPAALSLVSGRTARTKVLALEGDPVALGSELQRLLGP